ncbi:cation transporter [Leucobacter sp.]
MNRAAFRQSDREHLPEEQREALRRAVRWQLFTIGYTVCTIVIVAFVLGNSQAMKTAWIEDMLSLLPQLAFFVALLLVRRKPSAKHPYGWHRVMGIGHLVAGVALLAVGTHLAIEAVTGLVAADHPTIGTVRVLGHTVWLGWIMIGVMAVIVVGPVLLYGPAKSRIAPVLHNKLLYADADMAKADWQTNAASIVGVLGVGLGLWWLDGAAALFISLGIVWDGLRNTGAAVSDLMDQRARTVDGAEPHPLGKKIVEYLRAQEWVADAAVRIRDEGQVLHVEAFVQPYDDSVPLEALGAVAEGIEGIDWKIHDVVVVPSDPLPEYADRGR